MGPVYKIMIFQTYVKCDNGYLMACVSKPSYYKSAILLLPGYSQSKSDLDYYLTSLRNELEIMDYLIIQVDLYGHGDSFGRIKDFTPLKFIENVDKIVLWIKSKFKTNTIVVTRGIFALFIMTKVKNNNIVGSINLNPSFLCNREIKIINNILRKSINAELDIFEFTSFYECLSEYNKEMILLLFSAFGAEIRNLKGSKLSLTTISSFLKCSRCYEAVELGNRKTYIIYSKNIADFDLHALDKKITPKALSFYKNAFIRDPNWNFSTRDIICKLVKENF